MDPVSGVVTTLASQGAQVVTKQAETFISKVLGEPGEALGGLLADKINARRHRNLIKIVAQAQNRLNQAGLEAKTVPLKIIHPLLESASLEEEPELQDIWANLLSNAADPRESDSMPTIFAAMMSNLTARDAKFLNAFYDARDVKEQVTEEYARNLLEVAVGRRDLAKIAGDCAVILPNEEAAKSKLDLIIDALLRNGILREEFQVKPFELSDRQMDDRGGRRQLDPVEVNTMSSYKLTRLGIDFLLACRAPR